MSAILVFLVALGLATAAVIGLLGIWRLPEEAAQLSAGDCFGVVPEEPAQGTDHRSDARVAGVGCSFAPSAELSWLDAEPFTGALDWPPYVPAVFDGARE